jgi:hypothetical protein
MNGHLQPGTRGSDVDRGVEDSMEDRPCPVCGHDAGECTCLVDTDTSEPLGYEEG